MIKIFRGDRGGDIFKTPSPMKNFCLYPPPVLRCFWKDPLMTLIPTTPLQASFTATLPPPPPPLPPSPEKFYSYIFVEIIVAFWTVLWGQR